MSGIVYVAPDVPEATRASIDGACASLGLVSRTLEGAPLDETTRAIVGVVRSADRSVPEDLRIAIAGAAENPPPVVLLASEPLVRPVVTLDGGRVVVVETPSTRTRTIGVLRMVTGVPCDRDGRWESRMSPIAWSAFAAPVVSAHDETLGVAAIIPYDDAGELPSERELRGIAVEALNDATSIARAARTLGAGAGMLCMTQFGWHVYWPRPDRGAWLHSHARLPHVIDLAKAAARTEKRLLKFSACSGDVAAAFCSQDDVADVVTAQLLLEDGAAAALEQSGTLRRASGVITEVR